MTVLELLYKKDLKSLIKKFNIDKEVTLMISSTFVATDGDYFYKRISDLEEDYELHKPVLPEKKELDKNCADAIKDLKKLEKKHNIDLSSFINTFKSLKTIKGSKVPDFKTYFKDMVTMSENYEFINTMEVKKPFVRVKRVSNRIWLNTKSNLSTIETRQIRNALDKFETVKNLDGAFIYWPMTLSGHITDEAHPMFINSNSILLRLNFPLLNKKLMITDEGETVLLYPIFEYDIDLELLEILNKFTGPNIRIAYGRKESMQNIFGI